MWYFDHSHDVLSFIFQLGPAIDPSSDALCILIVFFYLDQNTGSASFIPLNIPFIKLNSAQVGFHLELVKYVWSRLVS